VVDPTGAIHLRFFTCRLVPESRCIATLLAEAPEHRAPRRKVAEYEDGGLSCQFADVGELGAELAPDRRQGTMAS